MGVALSSADLVFVADLYLAREDPDPAVTAALVAEAVNGPPVHLVGPIAETAAAVHSHVRPGDLVLTLGAGDIAVVGRQLLDLLDGRA
jgi:UDP-N-acetylmuramate--alanine ligase